MLVWGDEGGGNFLLLRVVKVLEQYESVQVQIWVIWLEVILEWKPAPASPFANVSRPFLSAFSYLGNSHCWLWDEHLWDTEDVIHIAERPRSWLSSWSSPLYWHSSWEKSEELLEVWGWFSTTCPGNCSSSPLTWQKWQQGWKLQIISWNVIFYSMIKSMEILQKNKYSPAMLKNG